MSTVTVEEQLKTLEVQQLPNASTGNVPDSAGVLGNSMKALEKFGGFDLLESVIAGVQNMNPERKARRKIFLEESSRQVEREELKKTLQLWKEVLNSSDDMGDIIENCQEKLEDADQLLKKNLKVAIEETRDLERAYRSVALFFKNTESTNVKNVSIINAEMDQLKDLENTRFIDAVHQELTANYDRLDLRKNYSLLIIPGYLGSNKVLEKWAKMAYENKVLLVTDFQNLESPDDVMELFEGANLTGSDIYRSNVIMTCNWLVGRGKYEEASEEEDLFVPPAAALAGKIYSTLMSQVAAGRKYGVINEVDGVRFDLKKSEIADMEKLGLLPVIKEFGRVIAFSAKTLFAGDNIGLQTYSVVRVFDYVAKVMMDFLNRKTFENFTAHTKSELNQQIIKFLDSISGYNKLIEGFSIKRFEQDPVQKDKIYLDIHLIPYFPSKTFVIKLAGQKGDDGKNNWSSAYEQKEKQ